MPPSWYNFIITFFPKQMIYNSHEHWHQKKNNRTFSNLWEGGGGGGKWLFRLLVPKGFGCSLFFFGMAPSLHPLLIQDTPCLHCFGLYTLNGLSKHVKSAHLN
jgi:hypothetical protein